VGDHAGDAADHQDAQHLGIVRLLRQHVIDHQRHQRPVGRPEDQLDQRQAQRWQLDLVAADGPRTPTGKAAQAQVHHARHQQATAYHAQGGEADLPAGRRLDPAHGEDESCQPHVAQPVGQDAHGEHPGDLRGLQAKARVQAKAQGDAAHPGAQVEIEGIADEGHRKDLPDRQVVARIAFTQHIEETVHDVTAECRRSRHPQGLRLVVA